MTGVSANPPNTPAVLKPTSSNMTKTILGAPAGGDGK